MIKRGVSRGTSLIFKDERRRSGGSIHADASVSCKSNNSKQRNSAPDRPEGRPTSWEDQRVEFLWLQPVAG
ncbi:hypothetical protein HZH66_009926 [Vespula vulgaris]|uniref:Uncharacterized protein n=1 Tax=Vespula vulgaris TaxID=7454 RepID=A0A834MYU6_VESVU|nr:hypothetical protein HZH66_009926 [Vespula vulgaris]